MHTLEEPNAHEPSITLTEVQPGNPLVLSKHKWMDSGSTRVKHHGVVSYPRSIPPPGFTACETREPGGKHLLPSEFHETLSKQGHPTILSSAFSGKVQHVKRRPPNPLQRAGAERQHLHVKQKYFSYSGARWVHSMTGVRRIPVMRRLIIYHERSHRPITLRRDW